MLAVGGVGLWLNDRISEDSELSDHACRLHDLTPGLEVTPARLFAQIHPDDRARAAAEIQRAIAEGTPYDGVVRVKHGMNYRQVRVFGGASYDRAGLALMSVGGVLDLSEPLSLRARVTELEDQLRAAQRGDVVGRLAGGIAHDFNNMLTGILGCCEMLGMSGLSSEQVSDLDCIRTATLRAAALTRQLVAFGRRQALQRNAVASAAVLADVLTLLRRTVPENVTLLLLSTEAPGHVFVDVTQLHQVLTNLVINAAQAMPGGGRIEIGAERVASEAVETAPERSGAFIRFVVEDSGPGVPPELRERIFEPYFTTKAPGQGSGLGLSVVQGIVDQHQGYIEVRDGSLGGARFEVYLPVTEPPPEVSNDAPVARAATTAFTRRILLVEDEKLVRELTKRILVGGGFEVAEAVDGAEGLKCGSSAAFDVILTDVVLPGMSGPELVARLRERGLAFRTVYMSGYPADFVESRVPLGVDERLVYKPFTAATLLAALEWP
jgi:signal transduction histidine kinase